MKNLKLLNKKYLLFILFALFYGFRALSQEPVDIWNIDQKKNTKNLDISENTGEKAITENSIYKMQSQKDDETIVEEDEKLTSNKIKIVGLYDPAENGLDIDMWSNSNGDQILSVFNRINKMNLSNDASEILNILLLTNAHYPKINI